MLRWTIVIVLLDAIDRRAVDADAARCRRTANAAETSLCRVLWAAVDMVGTLDRVAAAWVDVTPAAMSRVCHLIQVH